MPTNCRYVLSNIETKRGVKHGERVWQARRGAVAVSGHLESTSRPCRTRGAADSEGLASLLRHRPSLSLCPQIAFGSGFKCNSAVWRALRPINDRHDAWLEDGKASATSSASGSPKV
jgi:hypothetical protein